MPKSDTNENPQIPDKKVEKNVKRIAEAIEHVYGSSWQLVWRNFVAGIVHALGVTIGYVLFLAIAIFIAQQLGIFDALTGLWETFWNRLPLDFIGGGGGQEMQNVR